jgi:transcriptional regulator with PAS, ATPase and Fis domain
MEPAGDPVHVPLSPADRFGELRGGSVEMRRIYAILDRIAPTDTTVLLQGETGTGKEVAARSIHDCSRRAQGPFVTVDCGSIPENLIESELFGHLRGAFSNAVQDRRGLVEEADGGTLFLDEVGDLPLPMQPKLLRVLETRKVRRIGSNSERAADVRIVAATHRPLAASVNQGTFREDLYYRLAVVEVVLPPLRMRKEDILALAAHFLEQFSGRAEPVPERLAASLLARAWPGNVRELCNFMERTISLGWKAEHAAPPSRGLPVAPTLEALLSLDLPLKDARTRWSEQFESLYVSAILQRAGGNVTRAAELAGVNRRSLQRLMVHHGIRSRDGTIPPSSDEEF